MTKKEIEIVEAVKNVKPINGAGYKAFEDVRLAIAEAMGYETRRYGRNRFKTIVNLSDSDKVYTIMNRMTNRGILKPSKSGTCYKLTV